MDAHLPTPSRCGPVYLDVAQALAVVGDAQGLRAMLQLLHELLVRDVPLINAHLQNQDCEAARALLHSLKGCLPIFCTANLCAAVADAEHGARQADAPTTLRLYAQLRPTLETLSREVAQHLQSAGAAAA